MKGALIWEEAVVYLLHVGALFRPGASVRSFAVQSDKVGPLEGWDDADLKLLIEEGRRQFDRQRADLDRIQTRSQWLFTAAGALLALLISEVDIIAIHGAIVFIVWYLGLVLVTLGLLGAAAVMSVRSTFGRVDAAHLSQQLPPVLQVVAREYAERAADGENTVATRLTVFRDAVLVIVVGAALQVGVWLATQ
jgi:hypothetical protein